MPEREVGKQTWLKIKLEHKLEDDQIGERNGEPENGRMATRKE